MAFEFTGKAGEVPVHLVLVLGYDHLVRAEPPPTLNLARRGSEQYHVRAEGMGKLDAPVAEAPKPTLSCHLRVKNALF